MYDARRTLLSPINTPTFELRCYTTPTMWETLSDLPEDDIRGKMVRALNLTPNWEGELLELSSLVVLPSWRGRGVGSAMLNELCRRWGGRCTG